MALIKRALSEARFESHRKDRTDTDDLILARYQWNAAICEEFYAPLRILEVVFRNNFNQAIADRVGANWLINPPAWLYQPQQESINEALEFLAERGRTVTQDRMVQEMSFGFWTGFLNGRYETLFHGVGAKVFPGMPKSTRTRANVSVRFEYIRTLRNRIFHFRRIWNRPDLKSDHNQLLEAIEWVNPDARRLLLPADACAKFYETLANRP